MSRAFDAVREENAAVSHIRDTFGVSVGTAKRAVDRAVSHGTHAARTYAVTYTREVTSAGTTRTLLVTATGEPA
jgi:hypothetical protein